MEWFEEVMEARKKRYWEHERAFYTHPSEFSVEPFRLADGLWYVGDRMVCGHMIETKDGLILLDSGYFHTTHLLTESIRKLGFDPADVKWILHTHEHFDHIGAAYEFRRPYGTKSAISAAGAASIRENPERVLMDWSNSPFQEIPPFDYEIADGEVFEFGGVKIRCELRPGHALGVLAFFFEVTDGGEKHLAGLFGGAGTGATELEYILRFGLPLDMDRRMLKSIEQLKKEPVTLHLGNHPGNNQTMQKREKQLREGGNPFLGAESWPDFLDGLERTVTRIAAENEEKKRIHGVK